MTTVPGISEAVRKRAQANLAAAASPGTLPPAQHAEALKAARSTGTHPDVAVATMRQGTDEQRRQLMRQAGGHFADQERLMGWLAASPNNARVARDDLGTLGMLERALTGTRRGRSWFGEVGAATREGFQQLGASTAALAAAYGAMDPERAAQQIASLMGEIQQSRARQGAGFQDFMTQFQNRSGLDLVGLALANPGDLAVLWAQNLGFQAPGMALGTSGGIAGAKAGASASALAGPYAPAVAGPAAALGGIAGSVTGYFAGGTFSEAGAWILDQIGRRGDASNPAVVLEALRDPAFMAEAKRQGLVKGVTTGAVDAVFGMFAGRLLSRLDAGAGVGQAVARGAGDVALETVGEAVGEIAGQAAATGEVDIDEGIREGIVAGPQSIAQVALGATFRRQARAATEQVEKGGQAVQDHEALSAGVEAVRRSELAQIHPEAAKELIGYMLAEGDVDPNGQLLAHFDRPAWDSVHADMGVEPDAALEAILPGRGAQDWAESAETGFVSMPMENFTSYAAGLSADQAAPLLEQLRARPEGWTLAEHRAAMEAGGPENLAPGDLEAAAEEAVALLQTERSLEDRLAELDEEVARLTGEPETVAQTDPGVAQADPERQAGAQPAGEQVAAEADSGRETAATPPEGGAQADAEQGANSLAQLAQARAEREHVQAQIAQSAEARATRAEGAERVYADVEEQLRGAGRTRAEARRGAALYSAMISTLSERSGIPVQTLTRRFPVAIGAAAEGVAEGGQVPLAGGASLFQTAFHGTPHRFDRFSLDAIGTGEGAQAFGWGLYFADRKGVAESYREALTQGPGRIEYQGRDMTDLANEVRRRGWDRVAPRDAALGLLAGELENASRAVAAFDVTLEVTRLEDSFRDVIEEAEDAGGDVRAEAAQAVIDELLDLIPADFSAIKGEGSLFTVDLAPAEDEYLLWDAPLSEQSDKVRAALTPEWINARQRSSRPAFRGEDGERLTAGNLYQALSADMGSARTVSEALAAAGIPGIKYLDQQSRGAFQPYAARVLRADGTLLIDLPAASRELAEEFGRREVEGVEGAARFEVVTREDDRSFNYVIFDDRLIEIVSVEQEEKGVTRFPRDPNAVGERWFRVEFYADADASTFAHELMHVFSTMWLDLAASNDLPAGAQSVLGDAFDWLGIESADQFTAEHSERLSRGFEVYLREGKAPTKGLEDLFATFRQWLMRVYRTLRGLDVELSPEIRAVYDRILASDDEIEAAEYDAGVTGAPVEVLAQVDEEQRAEYLDVVQEARDEARQRNDRDTLQSSIKAEQAVRAEQELPAVRAQVDALPGVHALHAMRDGTLPDGTPLPEGTEPVRFDRRATEELFGADSREARGLRDLGLLVAPGQGGVSPVEVSDAYGAESAQVLVDQVLRFGPDKERVVEGMAAARARAQTSELAAQPVARRQRARENVAGPHRTRLLQADLRLFQGLQQRAEVEAGGRAVGAGPRPGRQVLAQTEPIADVRARAERFLRRRSLRETRPHTFYAAARRASRAAMARAKVGDFAGAVDNKRLEIFNNELFRLATARVKRAAKHHARLTWLFGPRARRVLERAGAPTSLADQMARLGQRFSLRRLTLKDAEQIPALAEWLRTSQESREAAGDFRQPVVADWLLDEARRRNWQDLKLEELDDLRDLAESIYKIGRDRDEARKAADRQRISDQAAELVTASQASKGVRKDAERVTTPTVKDRALQGLENFMVWQYKLPVFARIVDGFRDGGPLQRFFVRPMNEAQTNEQERLNTELATVDGTVFSILPDWGSRAFTRPEVVPGLGREMSHEDRLGFALHWGNVQGRERLVTGSRFTEANARAIFATLTEQDVRFLNALTSYYETLWPEVADLERRTSGVVPARVEARPYDTPAGRVNGGYHPLSYMGRRADKLSVAEQAAQVRRGAFASSQTRQGHTKARQQSVGMPPRLDLMVAFEHVHGVVHDLTHREILHDLSRLVRDDGVKAELSARWGDSSLDLIEDTLTDLAAGSHATTTRGYRVANWFRARVSSSILAFKVMTGAVNVTGLFQSFRRVGAKHVLAGMGRAWRSPQSFKRSLDLVREKSPFMRQRAQNLNQTLFDVRKKLSGVRLKAWEDWGWLVIQWTQNVVDVPTWLGAYRKAMSQGESDAEAVQQADQAVRDSQGSAQLQDLSQAQRENEWVRLFTIFYFYLNTTLNQTRESVQQFKRSERSVNDAAKLGLDMMTLYFFPALAMTLSRMVLRGAEDEPEDTMEWWQDVLGASLNEALSMGAGSMMLIREFSGGINGFDYTGPAGLRLVPETIKLARQIGQWELDAGLRKSLLNVTGLVTGLPASQLNTTLDGFEAYSEGEVTGVRAVLAPIVGPPYREL